MTPTSCPRTELETVRLAYVMALIIPILVAARVTGILNQWRCSAARLMVCGRPGRSSLPPRATSSPRDPHTSRRLPSVAHYGGATTHKTYQWVCLRRYS